MIATPLTSEPHGPRPASRRRAGRLLAWCALLACFIGVTYVCYAWSMQSGIGSLRDSASQRLKVFEGSLETILSRYDYLPRTLELNPAVTGLLEQPGDPERVSQANRFLEKINNQAGSNVIYILDLRGVTLASSNWNRKDSFVGIDLAYRPYVQAALRQQPGRFYAIGTTSNTAGYYFAHGIYNGGKLLGVATVKVGLDKLQTTLAQGADAVMLVDEHGVIFLSSVAALQYRTLGPLSRAAKERLARTHQYHQQALTPVGLTEIERFPDGVKVVAIERDGKQASLSGKFLMTQTSTTLQPGWRFVLLSDLGKVAASARAMAAFGAASFGCLVFLALYLRQRQLATAQNVVAKRALQQSYDSLEMKVAARTAELESTTRDLTQQIVERRQAERALQTTQDELIQAGKMAVLGQMSAGITHELNQPLTALRTMSDNAVILLDRGRLDDAKNNLATISGLVERMAIITRQLKVFARKGSSAMKPFSVRHAIGSALFLVERRIELEHVTLELRMADEDVLALGDANRLEQVLVNLFNNALDAMQGVASPRLLVDVHRDQGRVRIGVSDNGGGLSDAVAARLFEPFFTTKEQGLGLGLGLVISAQIVREFGGSLSGKSTTDGGAQFTVELSEGVPHA